MLQPAKSQYDETTSNVTQPSRTAKWSTQKSTQKVNDVSRWSTQTTTTARSMQKSQSQRLASGIVPKNADLENRTFGRVLGSFDLVLTKVNTGQSLVQKP